MSKNDKISLTYIISTAIIGFGCLIYSRTLIRKAEAAQKLDRSATYYAMCEVIRFLRNGKIRSQEDVDREFEFAYMNYRAHN